MNLDDWVRSGRLHRELPTFPEVERLLAAAARNLVDAALDGLSDESRFDLAYKAIVQSALVALRASGYRPATNVPGHHHTLVQSLRLTIHAGDAELHLLDMIRRRRNANDYAGRPMKRRLRRSAC